MTSLIILTVITAISASASSCKYSIIPGNCIQETTVSMHNEEYRFEVTVPANWVFEETEQQDPYEEMRTGSYSSTGSSDEKQPENRNCFKLISTDTSDNNPQPYFIIYAHKVSDQNREGFRALFEESLTEMGVNGLEINRNFSAGNAEGFDCTYGLSAKVRYSVLYHSGIRVVFMYFFPSGDASLFYRHSSEIDAIIHSLRIG